MQAFWSVANALLSISERLNFPNAIALDRIRKTMYTEGRDVQ
jgi:hypothetical protein